MTLNENSVYTKPYFIDDKLRETLYENFESKISAVDPMKLVVHQK